jgi:hypothetical protein
VTAFPAGDFVERIVVAVVSWGKGLDLSVRDPGIAITVKQVGKQDFQLLLPVLNHDELDLGTCSRSSKYICSCTRSRSGRQGSSQGFADRLIGDFAR